MCKRWHWMRNSMIMQLISIIIKQSRLFNRSQIPNLPCPDHALKLHEKKLIAIATERRKFVVRQQLLDISLALFLKGLDFRILAMGKGCGDFDRWYEGGGNGERGSDRMLIKFQSAMKGEEVFVEHVSKMNNTDQLRLKMMGSKSDFRFKSCKTTIAVNTAHTF